MQGKNWKFVSVLGTGTLLSVIALSGCGGNNGTQVADKTPEERAAIAANAAPPNPTLVPNFADNPMNKELAERRKKNGLD